jgi:hypothetical protein
MERSETTTANRGSIVRVVASRVATTRCFVGLLRTRPRTRTLALMRRQYRSEGGSRQIAPARALMFVSALTLMGVGDRVEAAPIEATGIGSANAGEADRARDRAITAARKAALEQAIASVDVPVDPNAVKQVLARPDAWTGAYRVLEVRSSNGGVEVRIEVDVDLPRLRKRIAEPSAASNRAGFAWAALSSTGCPMIDEPGIRDSLRAYGIVAADGPTKLSLAITCNDRGAVSHTHVRAAAVEIVARTRGEVELEVRVKTQGFAEDPGEASKIALERSVAELADELAVVARGDLELRVEQPWPAARITTLSNALRDAVIGVDTVELAGIASDGSVVLRVGGSLDAKALGRRLQEASFPGFSLVGLRVDGAHALRVRLQ